MYSEGTYLLKCVCNEKGHRKGRLSTEEGLSVSSWVTEGKGEEMVIPCKWSRRRSSQAREEKRGRWSVAGVWL